MLSELHDTLAQRLVTLRVHLDSAGQSLAGSANQGTHDAGPPGARPPLIEAGPADHLGAAAEHIRQASAIAGEALVEARLTLLGVAAEPLDGRTLEAALRSEVAWAESTGHLEVRFVTAGAQVALDSRLAREVLRIAREALTNIVGHAQARTVRLGLLYEPGAVSLLVQDDGQGFDPRSNWQSDRFGLRAMSDRAAAIGATLDVDSLPGWGTRIRARFPYVAAAEPAARRLTVLVAARHPALRAGLARLLTWTEPGIEVVGEVATAAEAVAACQALAPDVVLADLSMPGPPAAGGVAGLLIGGNPELAVVGVCDAADERVADAMRAGARGCVDTGADGPELARAVVAAGRGQAILSGPVLRQLHRGLREEPAPALTDREREVRGLMEQGLPDKLIAERLVLSVKTVEKHAGAVPRKTGARNRTELAAHASQSRPR
jgi:DNA-binding NarL/FixJ family response regulator